MAGDAEVIREFLVSLGFKVDQDGLKKFVGGLGATKVSAMDTGKAVLGVAIAAEAMVVQFSSSMEKLYYQSKRTHASVENLQGLEFGSRKIGLAAGVARDALESMVSAARMNPGLRGLIDGLLGKNTAGLDQVQVMTELVQKLSSMPHFQGAQFAQMFGMDEKTFLMLKEGLPELIKAEEERRTMNRQAGIDAEAAAKAGQEYANSIRDITERLGVLRDRMAVDLLPSFRDFNKEVVSALDNLAKFKLSEHPTLEKASNRVMDSVKGTGRALGDIVFGGVNLDGGRVWKGVKGIAEHGGGGIGLTTDMAAKGGVDLLRKGFHAVNDWRDSYRPGGSRSGNPAPPAAGTGELPGVGFLHRKFDAMKDWSERQPPPVLPVGMRQNNPGNMRKWENGQETRNGFVVFPNAASGLSAMAAQLLKYQAGGLNSVRDIIATWAPKKDGNNTGAYVDDVSQRLGVRAGDKLNLKDPATLSRLMGAMVHHEQGYTPFGSAELMAAAQSRLGGQGKSVTINSKTDIHVNGADSPTETGRSVALVQDQVNGNMVRNMRGAVQ